MNKELAHQLKDYVDKVKDSFSRKDREGNINNETFSVKEIIPTSDLTACVIFKKNTGKEAAFFFYYIKRGMSKGWKYFVPTDSHITGMRAFEFYKMQVEHHNYKENF